MAALALRKHTLHSLSFPSTHTHTQKQIHRGKYIEMNVSVHEEGIVQARVCFFLSFIYFFSS